MVLLKKKAKENNFKYQNSNCHELMEINGESLMNEYAIQEWFDYYQPKQGEIAKTKISGILDCFCKD